jgi:hypothetical protein
MAWKKFANFLSYCLEKALRAENPADARIAGIIYEYGLGREPDPHKADLWFRAYTADCELARTRAALKRLEGRPKDEAEIVANEQCSIYDPRVFDKELENYIIKTVHSANVDLNLNLSADQEVDLAEQLIGALRPLLPPPPIDRVETVRLPTVAPERYADRKVDPKRGRKENIVEFLTRVYAKEMEAGIIEEAHLSSLDRSAYNAIYSWNSNHHNEPFRLARPQSEINKEIGQRLEVLRIAALQQGDPEPQVAREQLRQVKRLEGLLHPSPSS